jgi:hypothetical protein
MKSARDNYFGRSSRRWELAQGVAERPKAPITKLLPIGQCLHAAPAICLSAAGSQKPVPDMLGEIGK